MRRMMHAVAFLLLTTAWANAQSDLNPLAVSPNADAPYLQPARSPSDAIEHQNSIAVKVSGSPLQPGAAPSHSSAEIAPTGCGCTYSQLALFMNCNETSPNLWSSYACERAKLTAHIYRHVDGRCNCFDNKRCLHAQPSTPCAEPSCDAPAIPRIGQRINRYKLPLSSLYAEPSNCAEPGCSTSGVNAVSSPMRPSAGTSPSPTSMAKPPQDRVATPRFLIPGMESTLHDSASGYETRR
jgi:hypothetical protein